MNNSLEKFNDSKIVTTINENPYRIGSRHRRCFELIRKNQKNISIKKILRIFPDDNKALIEMIGQGIIAVENFPVYNDF